MPIMIVGSFLGDVARRLLARVVSPTAVVVAAAGTILAPADDVQAQTIGDSWAASFVGARVFVSQTTGIDPFRFVTGGLSARALTTASTQLSVTDYSQPLFNGMAHAFSDPNDNSTGNGTASMASAISGSGVPMSFDFRTQVVASANFWSGSVVTTTVSSNAYLSDGPSSLNLATFYVPNGTRVRIDLDASVLLSSSCYKIDQFPEMVGCQSFESAQRGAAGISLVDNATGEVTRAFINVTTPGEHSLSRSFDLGSGLHGFGISVFASATQSGGGVYGLLPAPTVSAVPEPGTYALMALGLVAVGAAARRHQKNDSTRSGARIRGVA